MMAFFATFWMVSGLVLGVVVGVSAGFHYGYHYRDRFKLWGCTCKRARSCVFFGTQEAAQEAAARCRWWNNGPVERVEIEFDQTVTDLSDQ